MKTMFENFDLWRNDTEEDGGSFMVACKDREVTSEERWVLALLSKKEAKELYEHL